MRQKVHEMESLKGISVKKTNILKEQLLKKLVVIYLMISPIFDLIFLYNHITTLIRIFIIGIFVILTAAFDPKSRKYFKYLIAYFMAMLGLLVISYIHSKGFTSLVPGNLDYSILKEGATLLKLSMPFALLFIIKYQYFSKKDFLKIINVWAILIAGSIVLCNICGCSLSSYTGEITNVRIFDWWKNLGVEVTATKGFFSYANQEVVVLLMIFVIVIYETLFENPKLSILVLVVSQSLVMLGTRLSTIGGLMSLVFMILAYIIYSMIKKDKISKMLLFLIIIATFWLLSLPYTPNSNRVSRMYDGEKVEEVFQNNESRTSSEKSDKDSKLEYIESHYNHVIFSKSFYLDFYPYEYDFDFWKTTLGEGSMGPKNYREMEIAIIKRIWEVDNRWTNYLFGLSNTRIQNVVNIEMDFILQLFAFGIVGFLTTLSFYLYGGLILLKRLFAKKDLISLAILFAFSVSMLAVFASGNALNFMAVIIPLSLLVTFGNELKE